jgi:hypothetical protein
MFSRRERSKEWRTTLLGELKTTECTDLTGFGWQTCHERFTNTAFKSGLYQTAGPLGE